MRNVKNLKPADIRHWTVHTYELRLFCAWNYYKQCYYCMNYNEMSPIGVSSAHPLRAFLPTIAVLYLK